MLDFIKNKILANKKLSLFVVLFVILTILFWSISFLKNIIYKKSFENDRVKISGLDERKINANIIINSGGISRAFGLKAEKIIDNKILASAFIDGVLTNFTIETDSNTVFYRSNDSVKLNNILPGDILLVSGNITSFSPNITLKAKEVRAFENFNKLKEETATSTLN